MILFVGHLSHSNGEVQGLGEVPEGEDSYQMVDAVLMLDGPVWQFLAPKRTLPGGCPRSVVATGLTLALLQSHSL